MLKKELQSKTHKQENNVLTSLKCPYIENKCPTSLQKVEARIKPQVSIPKLMRISKVQQNYIQNSPMVNIIHWVKQYLAKPHSEIGRKGPVCPFVPTLLKMDTIWMAEVNEENPSLDRICELIIHYGELFMTKEPTSGENVKDKAIIILFPALRSDGINVIDKVQSKLKKHFVDKGLMLGEFHEKNQSPGLQNSNFKPLRSPVPLLAIRHLIEADLPFLQRSNYSADERSSFLHSYIHCLREDLSTSNFNKALQGLIEAEIQKFSNTTVTSASCALEDICL